MGVLEIVLGSVLILAAIFLVVAIMLQDSKKHGLSGTIAGGAETFLGKTKGKEVSAWLGKATTICAIVFAVIVFAAYLFAGI